MNDMIENFPDKVICLLFSFFDKLKMETQCSDFLDGTSEGQVSRFRGFLQESICSWIRVIMMLLMGSSIETSPSSLCFGESSDAILI